MTCSACGHEEGQDRKVVLDWRECRRGHTWHLPLVLKSGTEPAARDCEGAA